MSQWDKLLNKILGLSNDIRFDELRKVLEHFGYSMNAPRNGGSHYTFRKSNANPITIPKNQQIKRVYIKLVKEIVEMELKNEKNN